MIFSTLLTVVADRCIRPVGWEPFSRSSSHSYPSDSDVSAVDPVVSAATRVLRQKRWLAIEAGTVMAALPEFTVQIWPVSAFSGRPPSAGGLKRGSRQVPVQIGLPAPSSAGSIFRAASVSLYETRVRYGVLDPSMLASYRVFQYTSLPLKNARLTPLLRAASTRMR